MNPEQRRLLADLLIQWEDLYKQGQDTPAEVLCKEHPELAETLTRQIAALKRVAWLDDKLNYNDDEPCDEPPNDPGPPKLLAGRYRLDQLIATGGFAEVWRAFDKELQRIIAVKIPKRTAVGSSESFLAEARRVARLKHPAILPVYDIGLKGNDCFFVSEYVEGGSLADRLVKGTLSPDQACRWIASIAEALNYAHASGVIHRDVKPANILIDAHGRGLLTDFGIAQSSMKTGDFTPSIGTLRYMAPEQLDGQAAVPQSDIYSLAVVLHEALAGKPPYSSADPNTLRREIGAGATISRDIPQRLIPILRKALNKDPGQRFSSAAEFASALRDESRPTPWLMPLGAVAAAGLLVGVFGWRSQPRLPAITPAHAAVAPSNTSLTQTPTVVRKEMPYPLPPYNRREWQSQPPGPAKTFRFDADSGWWGEYGPDGKLSFQFRQTGITDEYIDLADPHRPVWLRLRANTCEICDAPGYKVTGILAHGTWVKDSASPHPPQFDQPVTITSPKDTLETYVRLLAKLTGVPITINVSALQLEGITKNQSFGLDEREQPARNVLAAILAKADTQGRLRVVLRATGDGMTAIDITTNRSLETMKETITNSLGIEMRLIGPGAFVMGSDDTDPAEQPAHEVRITKPFYLGVHEVTNAAWKRVMGDVPSEWPEDDKPVVNIRWHEAVEFCQKLAELPEERAAGRSYRLPTEAEWEYSCRADSTSLFPFGSDVARLGEYAWLTINSDLCTHPVGLKKPNAWGLYDVQGNVWEWCSDRYGPYGSESSTDPTGPAKGSDRVTRGNGWGCSPDKSCASSRRGGNDPSTQLPYLGLRVAMTTLQPN